MDTTPLYRKALLQTFASEDYNDGQCQAFMRDFDKLTSTGMSGESATAICYSAWGSSAPEKVCRTIKDWISKELGEFNATHKGIDANPKNRLLQAIKTLQDNIDRVSIIYNGQELSRAEIDAIKPKIPSSLKQPTLFTATASNQTKPSLVIEVTI